MKARPCRLVPIVTIALLWVGRVFGAVSGFVHIPAGSFEMGDAIDGMSDAPLHKVYVGAFYMLNTEVTKAQWDDVRTWAAGHGYFDLPSGGGRTADHPVFGVSWFDVVKWCNARSEKEGLKPCFTVGGSVYRTGSNPPDCDWHASGYRLPTEAEWEKAARGGVAGHRFPWTDANNITHSRANYCSTPSDSYDESPTRGFHPDFSEAGEPCTSPVGTFASNEYGLFDMAGNVWEWCWDRYSASYYARSPASDPAGPSSGSDRVVRGGGWHQPANGCRVAVRSMSSSGKQSGIYGGFRIARSDFFPVPAGNFQMGDGFNEGDSDGRELPVHTVHVSALLMQATETTKAQWDEVRSWASLHGYSDLPMGGGKGHDHPVQSVSWHDAVKWCNARSEKEELTPCYTAGGSVYRAGAGAPECNWNADGYRLPTEAEWEKAARGGIPGHRFPWADADTITHVRANYYSTNVYPYDVSATRGFHPDFNDGGEPCTSPVGAFAPNDFGFCDMAGNVWEWCWNWYSEDYYKQSPPSDPHGPSSGAERVLRGGGWCMDAVGCRVAHRNSDKPGLSSNDYGFRPVRTVPVASTPGLGRSGSRGLFGAGVAFGDTDLRSGGRRGRLLHGKRETEPDAADHQAGYLQGPLSDRAGRGGVGGGDEKRRLTSRKRGARDSSENAVPVGYMEWGLLLAGLGIVLAVKLARRL